MKSYAIALILLAGCQTQPTSVPRLTPSELYRLHCSGCHGDGSGNGHIASTLKVRPRNLKHKQWQSSVSDKHIESVIRDGGQPPKLSNEMPSFSDKLTETEIQELAQYIRRLRL